MLEDRMKIIAFSIMGQHFPPGVIFLLRIYEEISCTNFLTLFFSLRTSETHYLEESFVFYEAIRGRAYFKGVSKLSK